MSRAVTPYPREISPEVELIRDVPYGAVDGHELLLDIALPKKRANQLLPAFVYMHGGAWESGSKEDGVPAICFYAKHGFVAASVGYRLSDKAQFPAQIEDCKCAVRFLRARAMEYSVDPWRIGAMGASSGGHLAVLLGLAGEGTQFAERGGHEGFPHRISAVCDLFGVTDFLQMPAKNPQGVMSATARFLGGTIDEVRERYVEASPVNYVHRAAPPFLIVHGSNDTLVPLNQSELLHDALREAGVEASLHVVPGAEHGSQNVITPEVRAVILAFLQKHLKRGG